MNSELTPEFEQNYQAGKDAFERGEYRLSVQYLEAASQQVARSSRLGGEVQMWLVNAYEAKGMREKAIALCQELTVHPNPKIAKQASNLLYILQAPKLNRPQEWMTEIPDLAKLPESEKEFQRGRGVNQMKKKPEPVPDLTQVNTKDNQFVWLAMLLILLSLLGGLFWLS
jgi:tetratricopeptide (TPR) repeat protein